MKLMTCPVNGPRVISEFAYGGELRTMPDPAAASDAVWADYVFNRNSVPAVKQEWWCHTPSGVWFIAERDTATDTIRAHLSLPGRAELMSRACRAVKGERIDRGTAVEFTFEGRRVQGLSRRHHQLRAHRGGCADSRPLLQIPPAARPAERRGTRCQRDDAGPQWRPKRAERAC